MSERWPYVLALAFVVVGLVGVALSPLLGAQSILACYAAVPALSIATYRAIRWRASFRIVIAVGLGLQVAGILAFLVTLFVSWLVFLGAVSDSVSFFLIEWSGFAAVIGLPVPGALVAMVGLIGALRGPGTPPTRVAPARVGGIE